MIRYVVLRHYDDKLANNIIWLHEKYAIEFVFSRTEQELKESKPMYIQHKGFTKTMRRPAYVVPKQ